MEKNRGLQKKAKLDQFPGNYLDVVKNGSISLLQGLSTIISAEQNERLDTNSESISMVNLIDNFMKIESDEHTDIFHLVITSQSANENDQKFENFNSLTSFHDLNEGLLTQE